MSRTYASEFVLPGHPDKLCDAIADALVQEACRREGRALCGVEVAIHLASVFITGRIACKDAEFIPIERIARDVLRSPLQDIRDTLLLLGRGIQLRCNRQLEGAPCAHQALRAACGPFVTLVFLGALR